METLIEWDRNGKCITCKNVISKPDGSPGVWGGPDMNAVLVQVFRDYDEEGNPKIRRFVTMLLVDPDMEDMVRAECDKVLKGLRND